MGGRYFNNHAAALDAASRAVLGTAHREEGIAANLPAALDREGCVKMLTALAEPLGLYPPVRGFPTLQSLVSSWRLAVSAD